MPLIPPRTAAARSIAAMLQAAASVQRVAVNLWPECYVDKPEAYTVPVTRSIPKMIDGVPVDPPEMEDVIIQEERTRMVPDIVRIQEFYDDAEEVFPGGGLALCLGLAAFGVAANYVHALDLNDGLLPTDLQAAANAFFGAARAFSQELKAAGVPEWVPLTPPVELTQSPTRMEVSALPAD